MQTAASRASRLQLSRRTPVAWRNAVHNKVKLLISSAAVAFAVLIMFMELGFLHGLYDSQTGLLKSFRADLMMVSQTEHMFVMHEMFPRSRLQQVAGVAGVKGVYPVYIEDGLSMLRNPRTGLTNAIRVIGFDPDDPVWQSPRLNQQVQLLRTPMTMLFDVKSRGFFGPLREGTTTELAGRAVSVAGTFRLGADYFHDGNALVSRDTFFTLFPHREPGEVFVGLIQLENGVAAEAVLAEIRRSTGPDVEVLTKAQIVAREKAKWQKATPTGFVFTMGVAVGFIIGVFICYQILFTDISDHLPQLATMKALGYRDGDLTRLVLKQALLLGVFGFVPAVVATFGIYSALTAITGVVTELTLGRAALVFALTLGMCLVSGLLALRKVLALDPAELF